MGRDPDELRERLRKHLIQGDQLTGVRPMSSGHSNETYLLEGLDLVLRMPPVDEPLLGACAMDSQYHLLAILKGFGAGPPVPAVRYLCTDRGVLGDEFYLMERVAGEIVGEYQPAPWLIDADEAFRDGICRQYVGAVASANRLPVLDVLGRPQAPAVELRRWRDLAARAEAEDIVSLFDELLADPLPLSGPPALVHGDPKPGNVLWEDGRLRALLDWEMCFNGEPLRDLGYVLFFFPHEHHGAQLGLAELPGIWDRQQVIDAWSAATGRPTEGVERYEVGALLEMTSILAYGSWLFATGKSLDARLEPWGAWLPQLADTGARMLADLSA